MVNKDRPHVWLIEEDDRDRQIANGFAEHYAVDIRRIGRTAPAGGWPKVLDTFEQNYISLLRGNPNTHVVMLIDFDGKLQQRFAHFQSKIPADVLSRVFVIGSKEKPETLHSELKLAYEEIGRQLAQDCFDGVSGQWGHAHLVHNDPELRRMANVIKPILFPGVDVL